jgi:hypothetical protein
MSTNPYAEASIDPVPIEATLVDTPKKKSRLPIILAIVVMGYSALTFTPTDLADPAIVGEAEVQGQMAGQLIGNMFAWGVFA